MNTPDDFEATPQYYGFPEKPMPHQVKTWGLQELFLAAYAKTGHRGQSAKEAGITIWCIDKWVGADVYSIKKRMQLAHQRYVESLEQLMDERLRNPTGNRGSDILLMFKLKAVAPEKYREEVKVLGMGAPLQILDKLRELGAKEIKGRELEAPAIEGEFKEVEDPRGPAPAPTGNPPPESRRVDISMNTFPVDTSAASPQPPKRPKREQGRMKRR